MEYNIKALATALSGFQKECPVIEKDSSGYGYKYASLPLIVKTITPIMHKHKLTYTQIPGVEEDGKISVTTILFHTSSGEFIQGTLSEDLGTIPKGMTSVQAKGSIITYLRRYSLSGILGIVTDEDIDGADPNEGKKKAPAKAPVKAAAKTTPKAKQPVKWLSDESFKKVLEEQSAENVKKTLDMYSKAPYAMKKEYRTNIEAHLKTLENAKAKAN